MVLMAPGFALAQATSSFLDEVEDIAPTAAPAPRPDQQTEAGLTVDCPNCKINKNFADLKAVVSGKLKLSNLATWKRHRGLVQIPTKGTRGNVGPCGSFHYNPDRYKGELLDNYANPTTACVFMSVLQDWKKRCPSTQAGCRVAWGDISHKTKRKFNGHSSHTKGTCIDIRPMRRGGFADSPLFYPDSDRATTKEFIKLLKSKGSSLIYYNDPKSGGSKMGGHSNHIHVCYPPNKTTKNVCKNFTYDPAVCGPE